MSTKQPKTIWGLLTDYIRAERNKIPLDTQDETPIAGKIVVITGANSGIGASAALQFAQRGARLLMPCRDLEKAEVVVKDIKCKVPGADLTLFSLDLADLASVRACAAQIRARVDHIDILINNAGIVFPNRSLSKTKDGFETHMGINHLGPFLFTNLLLDLVTKAAPSRIVFTASMAWQRAVLDLDDLMCEKTGTFGLFNEGPYSNSKLANMCNAYSLSKRLEGTGVHTYALCPGTVRSDLGRNFSGWLVLAMVSIAQRFALTVEEGASTILYCALSKKCADETGLMYRCNGLWTGAMQEAVDDRVADKLWELSENLVAKGNNEN